MEKEAEFGKRSAAQFESELAWQRERGLVHFKPTVNLATVRRGGAVQIQAMACTNMLRLLREGKFRRITIR